MSKDIENVGYGERMQAEGVPIAQERILGGLLGHGYLMLVIMW